jgi:sporulation protein YlmC with PRC-barrel domain
MAGVRAESPTTREPARLERPEPASCRALEGEIVFDRHGEEVGRIARVMIELRTGRVTHAVIACGGVLGIGERFHGVPWSKLAFNAEQRCFVLDLEGCEPR